MNQGEFCFPLEPYVSVLSWAKNSPSPVQTQMHLKKILVKENEDLSFGYARLCHVLSRDKWTIVDKAGLRCKLVVDPEGLGIAKDLFPKDVSELILDFLWSSRIERAAVRCLLETLWNQRCLFEEMDEKTGVYKRLNTKVNVESHDVYCFQHKQGCVALDSHAWVDGKCLDKFKNIVVSLQDNRHAFAKRLMLCDRYAHSEERVAMYPRSPPPSADIESVLGYLSGSLYGENLSKVKQDMWVAIGDGSKESPLAYILLISESPQTLALFYDRDVGKWQLGSAPLVQ